MSLEIVPLKPEHVSLFKHDMQEAFQAGAASGPFDLDGQILPEQDIDSSLDAEGSAAYVAIEHGKLVGGVIVVVNQATQHNHLDFLYLKHGIQSRGIGKQIWSQVERLHPDTRLWETVTPHFDKRVIHFYINSCGFSAVEFYNPHHANPNTPEDMTGRDYLFRLVKVMARQATF